MYGGLLKNMEWSMQSENQRSELIKQRLYLTFYRLGISKLPEANSNMYIDDSGYVMVVTPDGLIDCWGKLSLGGDFIIKEWEVPMLELLTVMSVYEWCRVILALCQFIAVLGVPFVLYWLEKRDKHEKD